MPDEYILNLIIHLFGEVKPNTLYLITDPTVIHYGKNNKISGAGQPGHTWGVITDSNAKISLSTHTDYLAQGRPTKTIDGKVVSDEIPYNAQFGMSYKDTGIDTADSVPQWYMQGMWVSHSGRAKRDEAVLKNTSSKEPFAVVSIPFTTEEIEQVIKNINDYLGEDDFEKLKLNEDKGIYIPTTTNYYILSGGKLPSGEHVEPFNCGTLLLKMMRPNEIHPDSQFLNLDEEEYTKHLFRLSPPGVLALVMDLLTGKEAAAQLVKALAQDEKFRICFEYTSHCKNYLIEKKNNDLQP